MNHGNHGNLVNLTVHPASGGAACVLHLRSADGSPVDLGGYSAEMVLRPYPGSPRALDVLTTENRRLRLGPAGEVAAFFPPHRDPRPPAHYALTLASFGREHVYEIAGGVLAFTDQETL